MVRFVVNGQYSRPAVALESQEAHTGGPFFRRLFSKGRGSVSRHDVVHVVVCA